MVSVSQQFFDEPARDPAETSSKADNADSTALACGRLKNAGQLTGLLDCRRFFETPLNSGFLRRRADQRVENASED
jgi:hypothetical protein